MVRSEGLDIPYSTRYYKDKPVRFESSVGLLETYEVESPDNVVPGYRDVLGEDKTNEDASQGRERKLGVGSLHHAMDSPENA